MPLAPVFAQEPPLQPQEKTAIVFVTDKVMGMHCLSWILKHFPHYFKNFIFISAGQVDIKSFSGKRALKRMTKEVEETLDYFVTYCHQQNLAAESFTDFGSDLVEQVMTLCENAGKKYPSHMYFASQMSFTKDSWFRRFLHNGLTYVLERRLHAMGDEILLLPITLT